MAPDSFGTTLTAAEAAAAMAAGWSGARPDDLVDMAPQSDGGPGFVEALAEFGEIRELPVSGPLGERVRARWLLTGAGIAYIEAAQACGLHLLPGPPTVGSALAASSAGVGELMAAALHAGARELVIGLGGSACTDGGRGMVEALGGLTSLRPRLADAALLAATDVDNPMLGRQGAAAVFGPQKGADAATVALLDQRLERWSIELAEISGSSVADRAGAGAAGGLGAALLAAGARITPGAALVGSLTGRRAAVTAADLVLTGEGRLDSQSLRGKVVASLAAEARDVATPLTVLAGQVSLDEAQWRAMGATDVFSMAEFAGSVDAAMARAPVVLEELALSVAAGWNASQ